ncbi:hypothetical protein D3C76_1533210 [compost metagenome]
MLQSREKLFAYVFDGWAALGIVTLNHRDLNALMAAHQLFQGDLSARLVHRVISWVALKKPTRARLISA